MTQQHMKSGPFAMHRCGMRLLFLLLLACSGGEKCYCVYAYDVSVNSNRSYLFGDVLEPLCSLNITGQSLTSLEIIQMFHAWEKYTASQLATASSSISDYRRAMPCFPGPSLNLTSSSTDLLPMYPDCDTFVKISIATMEEVEDLLAEVGKGGNDGPLDVSLKSVMNSLSSRLQNLIDYMPEGATRNKTKGLLTSLVDINTRPVPTDSFDPSRLIACFNISSLTNLSAVSSQIVGTLLCSSFSICSFAAVSSNECLSDFNITEQQYNWVVNKTIGELIGARGRDDAGNSSDEPPTPCDGCTDEDFGDVNGTEPSWDEVSLKMDGREEGSGEEGHGSTESSDSGVEHLRNSTNRFGHSSKDQSRSRRTPTPTCDGCTDEDVNGTEPSWDKGQTSEDGSGMEDLGNFTHGFGHSSKDQSRSRRTPTPLCDGCTDEDFEDVNGTDPTWDEVSRKVNGGDKESGDGGRRRSLSARLQGSTESSERGMGERGNVTNGFKNSSKDQSSIRRTPPTPCDGCTDEDFEDVNGTEPTRDEVSRKMNGRGQTSGSGMEDLGNFTNGFDSDDIRDLFNDDSQSVTPSDESPRSRSHHRNVSRDDESLPSSNDSSVTEQLKSLLAIKLNTSIVEYGATFVNDTSLKTEVAAVLSSLEKEFTVGQLLEKINVTDSSQLLEMLNALRSVLGESVPDVSTLLEEASASGADLKSILATLMQGTDVETAVEKIMASFNGTIEQLSTNSSILDQIQGKLNGSLDSVPSIIQNLTESSSLPTDLQNLLNSTGLSSKISNALDSLQSSPSLVSSLLSTFNLS